MSKSTKTISEESLEKKLWKTADKLRKNMDAAEYKHVVLGLIFLKYISDAFEELFAKLKEGKANTTIDWTIRESARAKLMVLVKRTLNKYGYPPDKQERAITTVLKQAELLANYWTE